MLASVGTSGADEECCESVLVESNGWSSYRGTAANTAYVETDTFPEPETVAWTYAYEESDAVAAVDDRVYVRIDDELHALDAVDGNRRWKTTVAGATGTPAVADEAIFVAGERLTALDGRDGDVLWEVSVNGSGSMTDPVIADGTVYAVAAESLYAVDARDGSIDWHHDDIELEAFVEHGEDGEEEVRSFASNPVAVADGTVYASTSPEGFVALDADSGDRLWTTDLRTGGDLVVPTADGVYVSGFEAGHTAGEAHRTEYEGEAEPVGPGRLDESADRFVESTAFATSGEVRFVVSEDGRHLAAWDHDREEFRWTYDDFGEHGLFQWPLIVGDTAVVSYAPTGSEEELDGFEETAEFGTESAILGIDLEDGSERWSIPTAPLEGFDPSSEGFPYVVSGNALYVAADELVAIRPSADDDGDESDADGADDEDETDDGETDDDGGDAPTDDEPGDEDTDELSADDSDGETDRDDDTEPGTGRGTDDTESNGTADGSGSDASDESDGTPGFTTGAGLLGGGLTLEWLRRRATADESTE
ncbi:pyrrolo-quinoline quinone [Natronolimnohabitans innermongolicus JCM 12255]|uniref:Pyrrolo-quinoline quinone n=1 Tax=Natronolimnohabitans innermongolicus JCM 12255 TaxID=1227499 RepID=L9WYK6_9EURY|nr:pyrrolo-quinoline quinone [Natronolimnohabitans innermongolicus JCM 12255]